MLYYCYKKKLKGLKMKPKELIEMVREVLKRDGYELFDNRFIEMDDQTDLITIAFDDGDSVEQVKMAEGDYRQFYSQLGYDHILLLTEDTDLDKQELIQQEW
jgi:hypothetical protein